MAPGEQSANRYPLNAHLYAAFKGQRRCGYIDSTAPQLSECVRKQVLSNAFWLSLGTLTSMVSILGEQGGGSGSLDGEKAGAGGESLRVPCEGTAALMSAHGFPLSPRGEE